MFRVETHRWIALLSRPPRGRYPQWCWATQRQRSPPSQYLRGWDHRSSRWHLLPPELLPDGSYRPSLPGRAADVSLDPHRLPSHFQAKFGNLQLQARIQTVPQARTVFPAASWSGLPTFSTWPVCRHHPQLAPPPWPLQGWTYQPQPTGWGHQSCCWPPPAFLRHQARLSMLPCAASTATSRPYQPLPAHTASSATFRPCLCHHC